MATPSFLIVDGHSMIHADERLRALHAGSQGVARGDLAASLQAYQDATGVRVVLVFDGRGQMEEEPRVPGSIQVVYSASGQTADAVIERLVARYAARYRLTVATEDRLEQTAVAAMGGEWISARRFVALLAAARAEVLRRIEGLRKGPPHA